MSQTDKLKCHKCKRTDITHLWQQTDYNYDNKYVHWLCLECHEAKFGKVPDWQLQLDSETEELYAND